MLEDNEHLVWRGILDPSLLKDDVVAVGHLLADAAKAGDWSTVFDLLDDPRADINSWRPGGPAWFTPLHQAAWHGVPVDIAAGLLQRGAVRSLRDAHGRTAHDIRCQRDLEGEKPKDVAVQQHNSLALRERYLKPSPSPLTPATVQALDHHLAGVIDGRIRGVLYDGRDPRHVLRYPPVDILHEVAGNRVWFPVPGMYGGFDITLMNDVLDVKSWCRVVGGSGQQHLISVHGASLVADGLQ
ncbi:hypothetical protein PT015_21830 [Candidatus Mycobacterium wuenschmannii]|uniref:Ankyrin repeat domain-containing protein n=1 Tax=Candidatus Mycobacterium wuenschmannii TaxID=3027808 RepID=A0ABY8VV06_9MYCO|nr:hypothetical protein [Candidatus Mycobacterium wuenschmannii]WIM87448.1 hypothetical protein PT015_21830 [Candidatus Mycobacterium wuenschmannii]